MSSTQQPVLILGAGINGAALARELALCAVPVCVVDAADLAYGATAYSSRLIHGGLRYLEYREFSLVRESLAERTRLLQLAPQFVQPIRLYIPIENRFGSFGRSAARFLFRGRLRERQGPRSPRGLWLVRMGLWLYDSYARDPNLPPRSVHFRGEAGGVPVSDRYRWLCAYSDAQVRYPERLVVAMLDDARRLAAERGSSFELWTYHRARLEGDRVEIRAVGDERVVARSCAPVAIVNATGAWVDRTLSGLGLPSPRLMGGTKGTHLVTWHEPLRQALAGRGLYAEARDGRPVFVLPFGDATLIGTTDERFSGDPADAVATPAETEYLLATVNELLPQVQLTPAHVDMHYSGVRPLPYAGDAAPGSVTRRHLLVEDPDAPLPFMSLVGGKLTTCRSLAEEAAARVLARLGRRPTATSAERAIPGAEHFPVTPSEQEAYGRRVADRLGYSPEAVRAVMALCGTRAEAILAELGSADTESLAGTDLPRSYVRFVVRHEWVRELVDLVERRLMLLYHRRLHESTLRQAAEIMADEGAIDRDQIEPQVQRCRQRLSAHFGKHVSADSSD